MSRLLYCVGTLLGVLLKNTTIKCHLQTLNNLGGRSLHGQLAQHLTRLKYLLTIVVQLKSYNFSLLQAGVTELLGLEQVQQPGGWGGTDRDFEHYHARFWRPGSFY